MMSNKTAYFISCSEHYHHRFRIIDECLQSRGYVTTYITSDFDHATKQPFVCEVPGSVQLHAVPYEKNLSIERIVSHFRFAADVYRYLENLEYEPDILVVLLPPNFLGHYLAKYKRNHPRVKLVFDIFDMWPETFPSGRIAKILAPVFSVWAWLRDHSLQTADWVISECEYFRGRLGLADCKSSSIYLCQDPLEEDSGEFGLQENGLSLCYLGAINNVIGISEICRLMQALSNETKVTLHIIGSGEREQEFIDSAAAAGAQVVHYGPIYDPEKKKEIIRKCHYGLNIVNSNACIGLTMKSVDYFRYGLPIISNVPADTELLIKEKKVGIQLDEQCAERILNTSLNEVKIMQENVKKVFLEQFSTSVIKAKYEALLDKLL